MSIEGLVNIKKAITSLNPKQVRDMSEHPLHVALHASDHAAFGRMEDFFLSELTPTRRSESGSLLTRIDGLVAPSGAALTTNRYNLAVYDANMIAPANALIFRPDLSKQFVARVLDQNPDLAVPLAKSFVPFRKPYIDSVISKTCKENTLFSLATALPDVIPSVIELPWAIAEFASDTAFLTMNQVRMAFLLAAASDREVGYMHQKTEIATVIGSAFGWRALARQAVGKIPFGGGLIAKAAVAYAGTKVMGLSLERFYSIGFTYSRDEREHLYADALRQGKTLAGKILSRLRPDLAAKLGSQEQARPAR